MGSRFPRISLFALAPIFLLGCVKKVVGPPAPPFKAMEGTEQNYSMLDITRDRPMLVLFCDPTRPNGLKALKTVDKLAHALAGKAFVLCVGAFSVEEQLSWVRKNWDSTDQMVPVVPDPDRKLSELYGAKISPTLIWIYRGAVLGPKWEGITEELGLNVRTALEKEHITPPVELTKYEPDVVDTSELLLVEDQKKP